MLTQQQFISITNFSVLTHMAKLELLRCLLLSRGWTKLQVLVDHLNNQHFTCFKPTKIFVQSLIRIFHWCTKIHKLRGIVFIGWVQCHCSDLPAGRFAGRKSKQMSRLNNELMKHHCKDILCTGLTKVGDLE